MYWTRLRFFIPVELVKFEYFSQGESDPEKDKLARPFTYEQGLAFFVVNFNYSKADYDALTETEKMFIYKAYENKTISDGTHIRNAVLNAVVNANRKKNKKFVELFEKKQEKVDVEFTENALNVINEVEERDGKNWVDLLYNKNGLKRPERSK